MPDVQWLRETLPNGRIVARSNNRDVQARLCQAGAGVAVLPKLLARSYDGLREVPVISAAPSRTTWIGYHRDMRRSRRLRAFLDLIVPLTAKWRNAADDKTDDKAD